MESNGDKVKKQKILMAKVDNRNSVEFSGVVRCSSCGRDFHVDYIWAISEDEMAKQIMGAKCEECSLKEGAAGEIVDMVQCGDTIIGILEEGD